MTPKMTSFALSIAMVGLSLCVTRAVFADGFVPDSSPVSDELSAANSGDAKAMFKLGVRYQHGDGVGQDYRQAMAWYRKAAEAGNGAAMEQIGILYLTGDGVARNYQQVMAWFLDGAEAGDTAAMTGVGFLYDTGTGVPQDYQQALVWYERAADAGNAAAMQDIGMMYEGGHGVARDDQTALDWFRKSAIAGDTVCMTNLALRYEYGQGVPQDVQQGAEWYSKAADAGNALAMYNLALCYALGRGVPEDGTLSMTWLQRSAAGNYAPAKEVLAKIQNTVTPSIGNASAWVLAVVGCQVTVADLKKHDDGTIVTAGEIEAAIAVRNYSVGRALSDLFPTASADLSAGRRLLCLAMDGQLNMSDWTSATAHDELVSRLRQDDPNMANAAEVADFISKVLDHYNSQNH